MTSITELEQSLNPTSGTHPIVDLDALDLEKDRRVARATMLLLLAPTLWFARTDITIAAQSSELLSLRVLTRVVFLGALLFGAWRLTRLRDRAQYVRTLLSVSLITAICISLLNLLRLEGSTLPLRTPLMWLLAYYAGLVNRPVLQLIPPLFISTNLILLRLFWVSSGESGTIDGDILVIVVMNAIGALLVWYRNETRVRGAQLWKAERRVRASLEKALAELKQLRGIIPICAHCKEVRTECGNWQALEVYVRTHTDADFSHGICPECVVKHYSDLFAE